jgi:hypothetical protein
MYREQQFLNSGTGKEPLRFLATPYLGFREQSLVPRTGNP